MTEWRPTDIPCISAYPMMKYTSDNKQSSWKLHQKGCWKSIATNSIKFANYQKVNTKCMLKVWDTRTVVLIMSLACRLGKWLEIILGFVAFEKQHVWKCFEHTINSAVCSHSTPRLTLRTNSIQFCLWSTFVGMLNSLG